MGAGFATDADGDPVQVLAAGRRADVRTIVLATDAEVEALRARDRDTGFDLDEPPLIRLTVVRRPGDRDGLLLSYHLLLWDGWSREIVLRDLFDAYEAVVAGEPLDAGPGHAELRGPRPRARRQGPRPSRSASGPSTWPASPGPTLLAGPSPSLTDELPRALVHTLSAEAVARCCGKRPGRTASP